MPRSRFAAAILALICLAGLSALPAHATDTIPVPSITPVDLPHLLQNQAPAVILSGDLYLPQGTGPFPAVILKHGSGGLAGAIGANVREWAATMAGWGVAAFVLDSFGARGITDTTTNQNQLSPWAEVADSFEALKVLAADPRIDPKRIGIMGWSRGGSVAFNTALETARKAVLGEGSDLHFALHIAFFGSAEVQYRDSATDHAPMLFLHGAADNYVPIAATREFADWLKTMGNPVTFVAYPKTYHNFDVAGGFQGFWKPLEVGGHCDMVVDLPTTKVVRLGHKNVAGATADQIAAYFKGCITHGATIQYNASARADAVEKVHAFLAANFHLGG